MFATIHIAPSEDPAAVATKISACRRRRRITGRRLLDDERIPVIIVRNRSDVDNRRGQIADGPVSRRGLQRVPIVLTGS